MVQLVEVRLSKLYLRLKLGLIIHYVHFCRMNSPVHLGDSHELIFPLSETSITILGLFRVGITNVFEPGTEEFFVALQQKELTKKHVS